MPRLPRLDFPGAFHHITSRGNGGVEIFRDDGDRRLFLSLLADEVDKFAWHWHGYCLMGNHYHLLIETPQAGMVAGMCHLNGVYARRFQRKHGRRGHLFQGRYHSVLVQRDAQLLEGLRYLALNPVRAGMVARPEDWPWSHHRAYAGRAAPTAGLNLTWLQSQFADDPQASMRRYSEFVAEGRGAAAPLGRRGRASAATQEDRAASGEGRRVALQALLGQIGPGDAWLREARRRGYRIGEIAAVAGCHRSTVTRNLRTISPV